MTGCDKDAIIRVKTCHYAFKLVNFWFRNRLLAIAFALDGDPAGAKIIRHKITEPIYTMIACQFNAALFIQSDAHLGNQQPRKTFKLGWTKLHQTLKQIRFPIRILQILCLRSPRECRLFRLLMRMPL